MCIRDRPSPLLAGLRAHGVRFVPSCANGILPTNGTGCEGHGTHVASIVGGTKYGIAKNVTIVPAFSCFRLKCSDGSYRCSVTSDISANLE